MKMGESSIMTKTLICRGIMKKQCSLGKGTRGKREEGDRRSGLSVSAMDHVFRFAFVGVLIILERRNK